MYQPSSLSITWTSHCDCSVCVEEYKKHVQVVDMVVHRKQCGPRAWNCCATKDVCFSNVSVKADQDRFVSTFDIEHMSREVFLSPKIYVTFLQLQPIPTWHVAN
jgi:hypothetical protein